MTSRERHQSRADPPLKNENAARVWDLNGTTKPVHGGETKNRKNHKFSSPEKQNISPCITASGSRALFHAGRITLPPSSTTLMTGAMPASSAVSSALSTSSFGVTSGHSETCCPICRVSSSFEQTSASREVENVVRFRTLATNVISFVRYFRQPI